MIQNESSRSESFADTEAEISNSGGLLSDGMKHHQKNSSNDGKSSESCGDPATKSIENAALSDLDDIDKTYNITSDILFFLGSICYLAVADWRASHAVGSFEPVWVTTTALLGPLFYAFNATVEILWAIHNMRRHHGESVRRREATWDLFSNLFFGIGAVIDVVVAVNVQIRPADFSLESELRSLSVLVYFLSGLVSVAGFNLSCSSCYQLLIGTGDVLFFTGSVSDLTLIFITRGRDDSANILGLWLISASLWFVNSVLYLFADLLAYIKYRKTKGRWINASETDEIDDSLGLFVDEPSSGSI